MLRKLTIFVCLISFCPAAAGAQELALVVNAPPALEQTAQREPVRELNLMPQLERKAATVVAANEPQVSPMPEMQQPRRTHTGLTFKEFCEIHFGGHRWIYWAGAAAALVAIHVAVAN